MTSGIIQVVQHSAAPLACFANAFDTTTCSDAAGRHRRRGG